MKTALARLAAWMDSANPIIAELEQLAQETADLAQLHAALASAADGFPDLHLLGGAGPKLQARLLTLPAGTLLREVPALVLYKPWQTPEANYALIIGRPADIAEIEAQLPALKGRLVPLPAWLPPSPPEAVDRGRATAGGNAEAARGARRRTRPRCRSGCTSPRRSATWRWWNG